MKISTLLVSALCLSCIAGHADDLDKLKAKGQIVIGVRESSPPFAFFDKAKGSVSGYDIEFAQYVAKKIGLKAIFKTVEPADRIPALKTGRVDVLFATFAKTHEREKEVDYSLGYFVATQKMLSKKGRFQHLLQLDNMTVCVPKGATNGKYLRDLSQKVEITEMEDYGEVFTALREGRCEFASGPEPTMLGNLNKMPAPQRSDFELADVPIASEVYAVGLRKNQKGLQKVINQALIDAEKSGEAGRIFEHWFGTNSPVQLNRNFKIMR